LANIIFMSDDKYLVALCSFTDFGPRRVTLLINYFKNAKRAWNVEKKDLLEVGVKDNLADKFIKYRNSFNCDKYFSSLEQKGIYTQKISKNWMMPLWFYTLLVNCPFSMKMQ